MSKTTNSSIKKDRGTTLTLEQYNLLVSFLKDCIKPSRKSLRNAGMTGNLNSPGNVKSRKGVFTRFKSIAKRLSYRESDNELIFMSNSKIVLPRSMFEEVIIRAHKSRGNKHLNLTRTIQKLGEKYTIGCRQFGITEENVRVVVRRCKEGSCAQRNKTEIEVLKHIGNSEKDVSSKSSTCSFKDTSPTLINQPCQKSAGVINAPIINSIPLTVVKLPNGGLGFQSSTFVPGFTPLQPLPTTEVKASSSSNHCSTLDLSTSTSSSSVTNLPKLIRMTLPISYNSESSERRDLSCIQVPIQIITGGAHPLMAGQHVRLVTSGSYCANLIHAGQNTGLPIDLSKSSLNNENPVSHNVISQEGSTNKSSGEISSLQAALINSDYSFTTPYTLDLNNNQISASGVNKDERNNKSGGGLQTIRSTQVISSASSTHQDNSHCDFCGSRKDKEVIDLTGTCEGNVPKDTVGPTSHNKTYSTSLGPLPHPHIWYFYRDLSKLTNPYERISMCIKDMRLDLMRSMAGSIQAAEKMKKKMHYIQELITTQQSITQCFADFSSTMDM